jgi:ribonuclease E
MANKMLIDASHPEETRVVVVRGSRVEEFDFESASRRALRGNIYLAKVTRVEPSLQAAFIEYGGNRHGFLAFSEIHPDYYQIPVADRQALLEEDARAERDSEREDERRSRGREAAGRNVSRSRVRTRSRVYGGETVAAPAEESLPAHDAAASVAAEDAAETEASRSEPLPNGEAEASAGGNVEVARPTEEEEIVDEVGGGDALEEVPERPRHHRRQYKIQEVIKRRQILLVQVVKEERGNKGAALTTYLSLAGRYSVLMPNTGKGGGISRKITNAEDRKRLKEVAKELEVPEGMGIILRTAGASRTKPEIKRDYEYLMRLWESVRELTLKSAAPALVYEEGSLIKRAIRDLYNKDIDEVVVSGEDGYREAKDFMRMLMPSHAKAVKPYRDPTPLFAGSGVESQLDAMFSNVVTLRSGGYLVINPTEALVSIDVNSGRATREHNIEDTALKTNLEAAEEIARQLRLRDLAGLIVIDFIDMEERRNNRAVEKKISECLKNDRARIQLGRISAFGLLEMSRQRIRTGVLESSSVPCPHCAGTGSVRAVPSVALHILRSVEEALLKSAAHNLVVRTRTEVALYILNQKRTHLRELETRFSVVVTISADETLGGASTFAVDRGEPAVKLETTASATGVQIDAIGPVDEPDEDEAVEVEAEEETVQAEEAGADGNGRRRRRRRRRGRGGEGRDRELQAGANGLDVDEGGEDEPEPDAGTVDEVAAEELARNEAEGAPPSERDDRGRRRRRGRRGEPRRDDDAIGAVSIPIATGADEGTQLVASGDAVGLVDAAQAEAAEGAARPNGAGEEAVLAPAMVGNAAGPEEEPIRAPEAADTAEADEPEPAEPVAVVLTPPDPDRPKRAGWWSKAKSALGGS